MHLYILHIVERVEFCPVEATYSIYKSIEARNGIVYSGMSTFPDYRVGIWGKVEGRSWLDKEAGSQL